MTTGSFGTSVSFNEISRPHSVSRLVCPLYRLVLHCVFVSYVCTCVYTHDNNFYMSAHYAVRLMLWLHWLCLYTLLLFFVYACAPSLTIVTYIVFNYLTLLPALVKYMRFGILPFIRWLISDACRVFSAGTRKSTFVVAGYFPPLRFLSMYTFA